MTLLTHAEADMNTPSKDPARTRLRHIRAGRAIALGWSPSRISDDDSLGDRDPDSNSDDDRCGVGMKQHYLSARKNIHEWVRDKDLLTRVETTLATVEHGAERAARACGSAIGS